MRSRLHCGSAARLLLAYAVALSIGGLVAVSTRQPAHPERIAVASPRAAGPSTSSNLENSTTSTSSTSEEPTTTSSASAAPATPTSRTTDSSSLESTTSTSSTTTTIEISPTEPSTSTTTSGPITLYGVVREQNGTPLQGACVRAMHEQNDLFEVVSNPSGDDGRYVLQLPGPDSYALYLTISSCTQGEGAYVLTSGQNGLRQIDSTQQLDWVVQLRSPLYVYYLGLTGLAPPVSFCIDGAPPCRDASPDHPAMWDDLAPGTTYRLRFRDHPEYTTELYVSVTLGYITKSCPMQPPWWPCM